MCGFIVDCVFITYCDSLIVLVSLCSSGILCVFIVCCLLCLLIVWLLYIDCLLFRLVIGYGRLVCAGWVVRFDYYCFCLIACVDVFWCVVGLLFGGGLMVAV